MLDTLEAVKPRKPTFMIEGFLAMHTITFVTGGSQLHRECFIADILFSILFQKSFHGRGINPITANLVPVFVGNSKRLGNFLWAWNQDRENVKEYVDINCIPTPVNLEDIRPVLEALYAQHQMPLFLVVESNLMFDEAAGSMAFLRFFRSLAPNVRATVLASLDSLTGDGCNQALYHADAHIKLSDGPKDGTIAVTSVKNKLNDFPSTFALAKRVIDCTLVYADSDALDPATEVLYEFKRSGIKERVRVIDALAALNTFPTWPTPAKLAKVLGTTPSIIEPLLKRLQNMGYIDRSIGAFTNKGLTALRNSNVIAFE